MLIPLVPHAVQSLAVAIVIVLVLGIGKVMGMGTHCGLWVFRG